MFIGPHFRDFLLRVANKYLTRIHTFHMILLSLPLVAPQNPIGFLQKKISPMTNHIESQPFGWFRNPTAQKVKVSHQHLGLRSNDIKIKHFCGKLGGNLWISHQLSNTLETYLCVGWLWPQKVRAAFTVCFVGGFVARRTYRKYLV